MSHLRAAALAAALAQISPRAAAGELPLYQDAVQRIQRHYLTLDQLDPAAGVVRAAEAAEAEVPWLLAHREADTLVLRHGERGELGRLPLSGLQASGLAGALDAVEDAIRGSGAPLPDGLDLPVVLLKGLSRVLDKHSVFLTGQGLSRFDERISGRLEGIGARLGVQDGALLIRQVFAGGPAERAGLRPGDFLLRVDGVSSVGMALSEAVDRTRGPEGTPVQLEVQRLGELEPRRLSLVRAAVTVPNVLWERRPSGVGYIEVTHFSEQTAALLEQALSDLLTPPGPVSGLVIDLRDNSGGSMVQSCRAADLFLPDGPVLRTVGRDGAPVERLVPEYRARPQPEDVLDVPVVVLVGPGSASASEILAGALLLRGRAILIGGSTHGKGTVQKVYPLSRGAAELPDVSLKLTVARYLLPGDVPIEAAVGLRPDLGLSRIRIDPDGADLRALAQAGRGGVFWVEDGASRGDHELLIAERLIGLSGPGGHRMELLSAVGAVGAQVATEEDRRLLDALRGRGVDWTPADEGGPAPRVEVRLGTVDPAFAGERVELEAVVRNLGAAPLYRAWVALEAADPKLPWHGVTLPIGFLPPGEEAAARAWLRVGAEQPSREDLVQVVLHADRRPSVSAEAGRLQISALPVPPVALRAELRDGEDGPELWLEVENRGARRLDGVRAELRLEEGGAVELARPELSLGQIGPGARVGAVVDLRVVGAGVEAGGPVAPVEVQALVRVKADRWGLLESFPLELTGVGQPIALRPPELELHPPVRAPAGALPLSILARDDRSVAEIQVWYGAEQLLYRAPGTPTAALTVDVPIQPGGRALVVDVVDDQGVRTRAQHWVRGLGRGEGTDEEADGIGPPPED